MKKINRKLIPAFAMLLLSAVLMSTASFAWFSSNGQVTATGMSVSASAPAALWISNTATTGFTTNISVAGEVKALTPATDDVVGFTGETGNTVARANQWKFHALNPTGYEAVTNDGCLGYVTEGTGEQAVQKPVWLTAENAATYGQEATNSGETKYYLQQTFYLRLEGKNDGTNVDTMDLDAIITLNSEKVGAANDKIYKALRVAIVTDAVNVNTAVTTAKSVAGYQVYAFESDFATDGTSITGTKVSGEATFTNKFMTIAAQETIAVQVYIWFDGNDTDCTNNNSNFVDAYTFDISFQKPTA